MSKPENTRRIRIVEGPTILDITEDRIILTQGGTGITFADIEDFMEFVSRVGIVAVLLDQTMIAHPKDQTRNEDNETP